MFRRNVSLHLQGGRIGQAGGKEALLGACVRSGILFDVFFDPEEGGDMFLRNVGLLSADYMVSSQITGLFITTA
jgi:hypothetical protein